MPLFGKKNKSDIDPGIIRKYNRVRPAGRRKQICHATFRSLTFFLGGKVMACWHNKHYLLGSIPENTIDSIWNGEKLRSLRESIKKGNLECGCFECKKNILNGTFTSAGSWRYDYLPEADTGFPVSMDFQTDDTCNNECIMCIGEYSSTVRANREKKPRHQNPYGEEFLSQLEPYIPHLKEASFSGGEVFLSEFYYKIWDRFAEVNPDIKISVTTNGTVVNEKVKYYLEKLRFNINLSIDTLDKGLFGKIRRNSQLEPVLANLEYFLEYAASGEPEVIVRVCVMKQNWKSVADLITYLNKKKIKIHINQVIFPPYSALWQSSADELTAVCDRLSCLKIETSDEIQKSNKKVWDDFLCILSEWRDNAVKREREEKVDHSAEYLKCRMLENVKGYLRPLICFNESEKEKLYSLFVESLGLCMKEINEEGLKNAFLFYMNMPVNRLVDEFNIRTPEKILEFTKQAGIVSIQI